MFIFVRVMNCLGLHESVNVVFWGSLFFVVAFVVLGIAPCGRGAMVGELDLVWSVVCEVLGVD